MNETKIIESILAGQADEYVHLVERYQTGLIIHCERLVQDRPAAEDIAQDTFIKAYRQLAKFDTQKARFSTWLYHIATNMAIDHLRRAKRFVHPDNIELIASETMPTFLEEDDKQAIRETVARLEPPKYCRIIQAYYWQGLSYAQLAEEFGTTTNTIGTWMRRAKAQLRKELKI